MGCQPKLDGSIDLLIVFCEEIEKEEEKKEKGKKMREMEEAEEGECV